METFGMVLVVLTVTMIDSIRFANFSYLEVGAFAASHDSMYSWFVQPVNDWMMGPRSTVESLSFRMTLVIQSTRPIIGWNSLTGMHTRQRMPMMLQKEPHRFMQS